MKTSTWFSALVCLLIAGPVAAATANVTSSVSDTSFQAVGSGSTSGTSTATLAHVGLTANERAAKFRGVVVSASGDRQVVDAVGYMVPEVGWLIYSTPGSAQVSVNSLLYADLTITGTSGSVDWIGFLDITFTQNYAP